MSVPRDRECMDGGGESRIVDNDLQFVGVPDNDFIREGYYVSTSVGMPDEYGKHYQDGLLYRRYLVDCTPVKWNY